MITSEYLFWFLIFFWAVIYLLPRDAFAWPLSLYGGAPAVYSQIETGNGSEASWYLSPGAISMNEAYEEV